MELGMESRKVIRRRVGHAVCREAWSIRGKLVVPPGSQASDWKGALGNSNCTL